MAKLAIALCFLLVAYSVQGASWSEWKDQAEAAVNDAIERVRENLAGKWAELEESWNDFTARLAEYKEEFLEELQNKIAEIEAIREEIEAKWTEVRSCASSKVDWTETTEEIRSNTIACAVKAREALELGYQDVTSTYKALTDAISDIVTKAKDCVADVTTVAQGVEAAKCLNALRQEDLPAVEAMVSSFFESLRALIVDISGFRETVRSCVVDSAREGLESYAKAYIAAAKECAAAATTSSQ